MLPRAINRVIWRIALFYVASVAMLVCLMQWSAYKVGQSPFVTFFSALGVLVLMAFDYPVGTWTVASIPVVAGLLVIGWKTMSARARRTVLTPTIPSIALTQNVLESDGQ